MKISKSTYKLMNTQGMVESKKPSAATLMSSASVLSLGNRLRMGQESRRILSPTEQHSNNMILGPPKTTLSNDNNTHRRDRSQRIIERVEQPEKLED